MIQAFQNSFVANIVLLTVASFLLGIVVGRLWQYYSGKDKACGGKRKAAG